MNPKTIFKNASKTYYNSSIFFSKKIRKDIETLYAFVRIADDIVDKKKDIKEFLEFKKQIKKPKDQVVINFLELAKQKNFDPKWTDAFLSAMQSDFTKKTYSNYEELEKYMYGSAMVIGLMICKIIGIEEKAYGFAKKQGEAMQLINFIRDIEEDTKLNRQYIPTTWLKKFNIKSLQNPNKENFEKLIKYAINHYLELQLEAEKGYKYIPKKELTAIKTAADMYNWTALQIYENPMIVLEKKIKPTKTKVIITALRNKLWIN
jgi:15-cis-phytoene synthase